MEAAPELPITRVLQVAPTPGGDGDGGTSRALIGGIIAGAAVAIVLLAVLAFFAIRRHRGSRASGASGTTAVSSHKTNGGSYTATTVRALRAACGPPSRLPTVDAPASCHWRSIHSEMLCPASHSSTSRTP